MSRGNFGLTLRPGLLWTPRDGGPETPHLRVLACGMAECTATEGAPSPTGPVTARAARRAATIQGEYREFSPETIRGLMAHSARWSDAMLRAFAPNPGRKRDVKNRIRAESVRARLGS
jgi:hypothetical protein